MGTARDAGDWLTMVQAYLLRGDRAAARTTLTQALAEHPTSVVLRRAQAGIEQQTGHFDKAEVLLLELLHENAGDVASAYSLARMLKEQGRPAAAATTMRTCLAEPANRRDANLAISVIELLDDCDRKADAAAIATGALDDNPDDARLHAYAGMLEIQLGEFASARHHYLFALEHDTRAWEWHIPIGLASAQRYRDGTHPDFALFREGLQHQELSREARAELHFALGKACDDVGDYSQASRWFREGNATAHSLTQWSRKLWRRTVEARLASGHNASGAREPVDDFTPIFIVGMPRSGTTLLAELLAHHPRVCNRGELPWIARFAERPGLVGTPNPADLQSAAASYAALSRQDDGGDARWFIDKQPLNFRYIDLMLAMFPDAKIIHCQRNPRDTALSLWMQCFLEDVQGYSYDFDDIALVMHDCDRLMTHWRQRYADSIQTVRYEDVVATSQATIANLAQWLGLPASAADGAPAKAVASISTASLWQARQPISTRSVERWRQYASLVPELLKFPE